MQAPQSAQEIELKEGGLLSALAAKEAEEDIET